MRKFSFYLILFVLLCSTKIHGLTFNIQVKSFYM